METSRVSLLKLLSLVVLAVPVTLLLALRGAYNTTGPRQGFRDIGPEAGLDFKMHFLPGEQGENFKINLYDHGSGLVAADYDGDGRDDLLFLNQLGSNGLFRNAGGWRFRDVTAGHAALALADRICVGVASADFDNDGDQDLYVTSTRGGNVLFENREGRFVDITAPAGAACLAHSQTAAFFDCDQDGDLDLFVTNTAKWTSDVFQNEGYFEGPRTLHEFVRSTADFEWNVLFRNNGDRTFTDVTDEAGLKGEGWSGDVSIFDFDEDGDLDVFVTNMFGLSQLYANDGRGRFANVTRETLRRTSFGAIGSKAFDYNNDGRLDLFVADMHSDMWMEPDEAWRVDPSKKYSRRYGPNFEKWRADEEQEDIDYDSVVFGNTLMRNEGGGRFTELSDVAGLETFWPWGVAVGDFDNDGYEDIFLPSGMGFPLWYQASGLMMNRGDGTFVDAAKEHGIEPPRDGRFLPGEIAGRSAPRSSRCAATADFDGDGRLDLAVSNFNDRPYLFQNQFPQRNFAEFQLVGTHSNRDAIGAVMKLHCGRRTMVRQVPTAGGYLSQCSKTLHFGLGDCQHIDRAEIRWPSGKQQTIESPPVNQLTEIREPE